jgi:hypothetical protein
MMILSYRGLSPGEFLMWHVLLNSVIRGGGMCHSVGQWAKLGYSELSILTWIPNNLLHALEQIISPWAWFGK